MHKHKSAYTSYRNTNDSTIITEECYCGMVRYKRMILYLGEKRIVELSNWQKKED